MSTLRSITDDIDYYHRAFGVFHRLSKRNEVCCRWLDTEFREIVRGLNVNVTAEDQPMRVLSIGPGDGEIDIELLRILQNNQKPKDRVHCTVVEPAADMVRLFQERLTLEAFQEMSFDWKVQTLEDYQSTADNKDAKFHFISSIHSIYYVPDLQVSLKDLYGRLEPGGMMVILLLSEKVGMGNLWKSFPNMLESRPNHPTSAEVRQACASLDIPIAHEVPIKLRVDITACFGDPQEMTEDGRMLLDFLCHALHFTRDAPKELREEVLKLLGSDQCSEKGDGGSVNLIGDWKAFIIGHA